MTQGRRVSVWLAVAVIHLFSVRTNAAAPEMIHYQGYVTVAGAPFTGGGLFKFALVNAGGSETYWSHDG